VYYDLRDEPDRLVVISAIGIKIRNRVVIAGKDYQT